MTAPADWEERLAPTLADVEGLARRAFERLPERFRRVCQDLVIEVADFPEEATLDEMQCESAFDLLGLFRGVGLAQGGTGALAANAQVPNRIWLYRRPLLEYWAEHEETLGGLVAHVLIHEIGHHLGHSDADLEAIEADE